MELDSVLVRLCIESACSSRDSVERWRMQRRTLQRLPPQLASALLRRLLQRRLLSPSLLEAFKYCVDEVDLRGETSVDAEWMAYLGGFRYLHYLNVADCHRVTSSALWPIAGMTHLKELDLTRCVKFTDAGIKHLLSISTLEKLFLSETHLTAAGVALLASLSNLSVLDLGGLPVTDQALRSLQVLTKLQCLDLWGSKVSDNGVAALQMFPKLSYLNLAWTSVSLLPYFASLESLNMSNCIINSVFKYHGDKPHLSELRIAGATLENEAEAFEHIEKSFLTCLDAARSSLSRFGFLSCMVGLKYLDLSSTGLGDESVEHIARIGMNLRNLNLSNTRVSSAGVEALAGCVPNLENLSLSYTQIDDFAVLYISTMPALKAIDLSHTSIKGFIPKVGDESDQALSLTALESHHLEKLNLENTLVEDDSLFPLSKLQQLRQLSLRNCSLTDISLHRLSPLTELKSLCFCDVVLTNHGLDSFKPPATLEMLDIRGCWLLTEDAISSFHEKYPQVVVRHELVPVLPQESESSSSCTPPSRITSKSKQVTSQTPEKLQLSANFLDQRLKYNREELLALRYSSLSLAPNNGDNVPKIQLD
ncbi:uncharacterized protein LOC116203492 [Punica granatum]|uniref:Uncharacterized protein LOC116203492 n=1 Tax=Punica granatum TaxID=22663 RepID=A0A6P8DHZ9_PUNGR|nr:uncharacterized protein LOC116203492 [Punica granatum]